MAHISDEDLEEMLSKLKEEFGTSDSESVTENSYSFSGKHKEMREDLMFLEGMKKERQTGRLYIKSKWGFDK